MCLNNGKFVTVHDWGYSTSGDDEWSVAEELLCHHAGWSSWADFDDRHSHGSSEEDIKG